MSTLGLRFVRLALLGMLLLAVLAGCNLIGGEKVVVITATPAPTLPPPLSTSTPLPQPTAVPPTVPPVTVVVPTAAPVTLSVTQVVDKLRPSTALISVQMATDFGGTGSGWVYDPSGLVVTNAHVVTGGALIKVYFSGTDRWQSARVVGISPCDDLAVLQVDGLSAPAVTIAATSPSVGDDVVAIGYPKASLLGTDVTVTRGVVSKLHAQVGQYSDAIQTDAAINPGNSGGPLVNMKGELVGINTATLIGTTGINFAISLSYAKPVIAQLAQGKRLNYMGWNLVPNDSDLATQYKLSTDKGMIVAGVDSGSPASKAGLRPLDIIFNMEDIELTDNAQICDILRSHSEGQALKLNVVRGVQLFRGEVNGSQLAFVQNLSGGSNPTATS
ncbi:MAG: trypsin-like peptidase domain-containing protein, partial [Anaerolineae bacterium]